MTQAYQLEPIYEQMRGRVLAIAPEDVGVSGGLLAVLMETGYPGAVATLIAVLDGTTSLYLSSGGGVIGAGEHEPVATASRRFLECAAFHAEYFQASEEAPLPEQGRVRFQMVTDHGLLCAEAPEDDLGQGNHPLSPLFFEGHAVIAQVREHSPE